MNDARCRWCGQPAAGQCRASGLNPPTTIVYCAPDTDCWERTYQTVRRYPERTWTRVDTRRRKAAPRQTGPDLFDLLPDKERTA